MNQKVNSKKCQKKIKAIAKNRENFHKSSQNRQIVPTNCHQKEQKVTKMSKKYQKKRQKVQNTLNVTKSCRKN